MISHGDIFSEQIYEDILPFTIRDDLWSIEKEYDEMITKNKEKWKKRLEFIKLIF